jgi:hypothetical protein
MDGRNAMRLPQSEFTARPWRVHEITPDFRLEDVWELPTPGGPHDFSRLIELFATGDTATNPSRAARALFALRWKVGEALGWDSATGPTLRDRLPDELRSERGPEFSRLPFTPLYLLDDEWAAELVNRTAHAVLHLGWVEDESGGYRGQMAVLVKPNGWLGTAYMAAILPFRRLIVYPPMLRQIGRRWQAHAPALA